MKKSVVIWIVVIIIIIIGIIVWMSYSASNNSTQTSTQTTSNTDQTVTPAPSSTVTQPAPLTLDTATGTKLGTYVVDPNGMTLYTYNKDTAGVSNCSGVCAQSWPPYTVSSAASLTGGLKVTGTISAIMRADGSVQVTYRGLPLYYWTKDVKPGDTTGQGIGGFSVAKP